MSPYGDIKLTVTVPRHRRFRTVRELGGLVRDVREDHGWTQGQLAAKAHVSRQWLSAVERGHHTGTEIGKLLAVFSALNLDMAAAEKPPNTGFDVDAFLGTMTGAPRAGQS